MWARRTPAKMISPSFMSGPRRRATTGTDESGDYSHMPAHCNARRELAASTDAIEAYEAKRWPEGKVPGGKGYPLPMVTLRVPRALGRGALFLDVGRIGPLIVGGPRRPPSSG